MKKQRMKGTGLDLSRICLGTGNFGEKLDRKQAFELLDRFRDMGGNFIDTANVYCRWVPGLENSSEQYIGQWLKERNAPGHMAVATKGGHYDFSRPERSRVNPADISRDLEESLKTLGVDCIDLYWLHRDDETRDIGQILDFMEELVRQGKIRYYGASNFRRERLEAAERYAQSHGIKGFCAVSNQWSAASVNPGWNLNPDPSLVIMDEDLYQWHKKGLVPAAPFSSSAHGFFSKLHRAGIQAPEGNVSREDVSRALKESTMAEGLKRAYMNQRNLKLYGILSRAAGDYGLSLFAMSQVYFFNRPFQVFPVCAVSAADQLLDFEAAEQCVLDKELIKIFEECGVE